MHNKEFFEKVFSGKRMERYFNAHPYDEQKAILHYQCNLQLSASFYVCLSVFEIALKNALSRELETMTERKDWYRVFKENPELKDLNEYIKRAKLSILRRKEEITPDKIIAELTLGFWVSLFNSNYEKLLWKDLRRAFPYMPKKDKQRKNISEPLNKIRAFRNRAFHNESICWNLDEVERIHDTVITMMGWINKELPSWIIPLEPFETVKENIKKVMEWK
jgi:hypothetical protein